MTLKEFLECFGENTYFRIFEKSGFLCDSGLRDKISTNKMNSTEPLLVEVGKVLVTDGDCINVYTNENYWW